MSTQESRSSQFKCPHCEALYDVAIRPHSQSDYHTIVCSYCGDVMAEWHGKARHYRRRKRPRDPAQFAKKIVAIAGENGTSKRVSRRPSALRQPADRRAKATRDRAVKVTVNFRQVILLTPLPAATDRGEEHVSRLFSISSCVHCNSLGAGGLWAVNHARP